MPDDKGSQTLRAVIDSPENSPIVAITNVSDKIAQSIHVSCIPASGITVNKTLALQPKQTQLVRACSTIADVVFSPDALDAQFVLKPENAAGVTGQQVAGIEVTTDGPPGDLAAFGFVGHSDNFGSYFSAMNFSDPKTLNASGFIFVGVPVGSSRMFPATAYTPQVALTNFSTSPQTATAFLATSGLPKGVQTSSMRQVASVSIPAGSSISLNLSGLKGSQDWQNSFVVRSSGQPGDVMAKMMFKGVGSLPNVELIGKDEHDARTAGDHPWTTENGTRSTLFLFNHSKVAKSVTVRIGATATLHKRSPILCQM